MQKAFGTALAPAPTTKKAAARAALVDLKKSSRFLLTECFRQFGIETVVASANASERLRQEKFEACVLNLGPGAEEVMEAAPASPPQNPPGALRSWRQRSTSHALLEIWHQCHVPGTSGAPRRAQAGPRHAHARAPRIPPLRARSHHDRGYRCKS